jgi:glycosyltransferase involved in cell wall biosynthesis
MRILMVAYHFPPLAGSSGIQRTLRFAKYLPEFGWEPLVLTAHPRAYERTSEDQISEIPAGTIVVRAPAFDTARHLSIGGRYPGFLARPDRWVSWLPGAFLAGMKIIKRYKPDVIWSTYPIATAHLIGDSLHRHSGLPWVADFRDPMAQEGYPTDPRIWKSFKKIEERAVNNATLCTFTTPGAAHMYSGRYPHAANRLAIVENGYDEESFLGLTLDEEPLIEGKKTILHSGIVYPSERDPTQLFLAIRALIDSGRISPRNFCLRFRAPAHEALLKNMIDKLGLNDCVEIGAPIAYRDALSEMLRADILLIMQASNCNDQIPAKLYEYLRAGRPILALTDPTGDTANVLRQAGINAISPLDQADLIRDALLKILHNPQDGTMPTQLAVEECSRRNRTRQFASLLDKLQLDKPL